ncbi:hypothetical protein G9A89_012361 [Geosiphon pyriformis]|nr:hypothetical protein G9A89_012361 [Geosiphon pyriformis]
MFTFKSSLVQTSKKAEKMKILVNSDPKKPSGHSNRAVVLKKIPIGTSTKTVRTALSEFGIIKLIKMQLVGLWQKVVVEFEQSILIGKDAVCIARSDVDKESWNVCNVYKALLYTLPIGTNAYDIWDYVALVGGKTCVIDHHPVSYARARCTTVCFDSVELLDAVIETTPVLKRANLHWFHLVLAKCTRCGKLGHTLLACSIGGKKSIPFGASLRKTFSNLNKSRLAVIYVKHSVPVAHLVSFGGVSWVQIAGGSSFSSPSVWNVLLRAGFSSKINLTPLIFLELNDRFATLECSLVSLAEYVDMLAIKLNTPEPTNQEVDIVMSEGLGVATGGKNVVEVVKVATCNVREINNPAKQDDIIHWHKEKNNLVSIFTESKLKGKVRLWIVNKFDGVWVFTSGLDSGYLGVSVVIVINFSLAKHVCKVSEVSGWLLSIKLLFKNNLSVLILGLYADISSMTQFSQTGNINSLIAKAVNESFFVILGGDFNEDSFRKCASFKKCLDFSLVNALDESSCGKLPTWFNSRDVVKTIDYVLISLNLVNTIVSHSMFGIEEYFDTDHQAVSVLVGLDGLLNVYLNFVRKQANKNC